LQKNSLTYFDKLSITEFLIENKMKKTAPSFQDTPCARNVITIAPRVGARQNLEGFYCGMERLKPSRFEGGKVVESANVHTFSLSQRFQDGHLFANFDMSDVGMMTSPFHCITEF
jgi:hypothetical protein